MELVVPKKAEHVSISSVGAENPAPASDPTWVATRARATSESLSFANETAAKPGLGADRRVSVRGADTIENPLSAPKAGEGEEEEEADTTVTAPELNEEQQQALIAKKAVPSLLSFATIIVSLCQTTGMVVEVEIPWPSQWIQVMGHGSFCTVPLFPWLIPPAYCADTASTPGRADSGPQPVCGFG